MVHIVMALIVFLIVVVIHLLLVRQAKNKDIATNMFLLVACIGMIVLWALFDIVTFIHSKYYLKSTATLLYLLSLPLYIRFYRSVNVMTPSLKIRQVLAEKSQASYDELLTAIDSERFVERALEAMRQNGQLCRKDGLYSLTFRGKFLAFFARLDSSFKTKGEKV